MHLTIEIDSLPLLTLYKVDIYGIQLFARNDVTIEKKAYNSGTKIDFDLRFLFVIILVLSMNTKKWNENIKKYILEIPKRKIYRNTYLRFLKERYKEIHT